jgi:hypothetical protein
MVNGPSTVEDGAAVLVRAGVVVLGVGLATGVLVLAVGVAAGVLVWTLHPATSRAAMAAMVRRAIPR